ncbi:hypothetical protein BCR32DRAFT_329365 [Anaeromyces robustus]|uniref:Uncharacterized protein n=1 Tax=Anaeromyces robustus TaxID=1754192 RepID=A0A1Y1WTC8_9FUNG|nr:hypothetical protein BCR32DRAFT_329365 [Anaeromyces robustus]|eukprot:ORX76394.1 hypothetical protein BCR32DRAFT_329365 [Anaeromyces robustus]
MSEEENKEINPSNEKVNDDDSGMEELRKYFGTEDPYRIEHWYPKIREYTFETIFLNVNTETCRAITKYAESARLIRQSINFQSNLEDRLFIHEEAAKYLPVSKEIFELLDTLENQLDNAIKSFGEDGAFVKLSTRSPKDTAIQLHNMHVFIAESLRKDMDCREKEGPMEDKEWYRCGVSAFVDACCKVLHVRNGREAMFLILHSDRVYSDITRMELTNTKDSKVQIAIRRWDSRVVPALEFRSFVYNHTMTACTQYYKLRYDPFIVEHRKEISEAILNFHDQYIKPRIEIPNYTVDFAVSADLKNVICVELNNLPPSAGTALFKWDNLEDRTIIEKGPYQFRCNTSLPETSFNDMNNPYPTFINSLRKGIPEVHIGFSCDCCGAGYPPETNGIHGERYQCIDCPCSFDMCSECWKLGWGVRHVTISKNERYPTGHKFLVIRSPITPSVDAGEPPIGPKSVIPSPKPKSKSKSKSKLKKMENEHYDNNKNCSIS